MNGLATFGVMSATAQPRNRAISGIAEATLAPFFHRTKIPHTSLVLNFRSRKIPPTTFGVFFRSQTTILTTLDGIFCCPKPSDPSTPETPANLVATAGAAGSKTVIADWDDARRADSYRFRAINKVGKI